MSGFKRSDLRPVAADAFDVLAIVFVFLLIATSFVAFTYYSKFQTELAKWQRATETTLDASKFKPGDQTVVTLQDEAQRLEEEVVKLSRVLGFYNGEEAFSNLESAIALLNQVGQEFRQREHSITLDYVKTGNVGDPIRSVEEIYPINRTIEFLEGRLDDIVNNPERGTTTLEESLKKIEGELARGSGGDIQAAQERTLAEEKARNETLDGLRRQLQQIQDGRHSQVQDLQGRKDKALKDIDDARKQKELLQKQVFDEDQLWKEKNAELKQTYDNVMQGVTSLKDIVSNMLKSQEDKDQRRPDGEMLSSDFRSQTGWINLARKDRLLNGMKFEVFRYLKGGKEEPRGTIQVIQVGDKMSKVRLLTRFYKDTEVDLRELDRQKDFVLRDFELDPIGQGDMIRNRFYDKSEKRVFVLAGTLTGVPNATTTYRATEVTKLIEELGDEVHKKVTEETNYIVLGEGYDTDPNFLKAKEFGIPMMSERELLQVLGKY